jgi:hypothetical protein
MADLVARYSELVDGVITCWDRVVIAGTIEELSHKNGLYSYFRRHELPIEHLERHFDDLNKQIRARAELLASEAGLEIDYIRRQDFRKDERIKEILAVRGTQPGLVHVFAVIEGCKAYGVRRRRSDGGEFVYTKAGKCLHYYYYFIDPVFGLCYFRIPTYAPFRVQFYFNGHNWLASKLREAGVAFTLADNAFVSIDNLAQAQALATSLSPEALHGYLDRLANRCIPFLNRFRSPYRWSVWQIELATDLIFRSSEDLHPIYDHLVRTAAGSVKVDQVADFLGRKRDKRFPDEVSTHFSTRVQGTCITHSMGKARIKVYDKLGRVLRIETTASDVTFFSHRRAVEHRDGSREVKTARVKKTIYSLPVLFELMQAANERYIAFISALDDPSDGARKLPRLAEPVKKKGRSWRGFNLCAALDHRLLLVLARGEWTLQGMRNRHLRERLGLTARQISRIIKRLRMHRLLKQRPHTYSYYLTELGQLVVAAALRVRQEVLIPALAGL